MGYNRRSNIRNMGSLKKEGWRRNVYTVKGTCYNRESERGIRSMGKHTKRRGFGKQQEDSFNIERVYSKTKAVYKHEVAI